MRYFTILALFIVTKGLVLADTFVLPPEIASFLANEKNGVTDDGLVAPSAKDSRNFVQYVCEHWKPILGDFSKIAPDSRRQYLIVASSESLSPSDYVDFLNTLCDLVVSRGIPQFNIDSIADGDTQKHGFLACNYDNPRVAAVIRKLEALSIAKRPNDPEEKEFFAQMKSGKMKQDLVKHWQHVGERMPERLVSNKIQTPQPNSSLLTTPPNASVGSPAPLTPSAQAPASSDLTVERRAPVWPWVVGILALLVIVAFALKRRA